MKGTGNFLASTTLLHVDVGAHPSSPNDSAIKQTERETYRSCPTSTDIKKV